MNSTAVLPTQLKPSLFIYGVPPKKKNPSIFPVARLFGPTILEASKLNVLFLGIDEKKHPGNLPRAYRLTHCDITSKLTLTISQTINGSLLQEWYNGLLGHEVVAEWKKVKENVHISGGHFLLDLFAKLRFFIFSKEIPLVARLLGPAIFEASKLKVLFLGTDEKKHPGNLPRTYTLTHSDITSKLTLVISQTINGSQLQGWYNRLLRDEVVAEWKKVKGKMSLHVHCHISGGHFLLHLFAKLRFFIFCKELPVVLKAFVHGDGNLFQKYPELEEGLVWVYFHSNLPEFNRVECWGPLKNAAAPSDGERKQMDCASASSIWVRPEPCEEDCTCCFPQTSSTPWSHELSKEQNNQIQNHNQSLQHQELYKDEPVNTFVKGRMTQR